MITVCFEKDLKHFLTDLNSTYSHWSYLGQEYQKLNSIAKKLKKVPYKNINYLFDKISKGLKDDFIELVSSFVSEKTELCWWCSNLSHKSGYTCKLLISFVLFFVFEEILRSNSDKDILLIVESLPLYNVLYANFSDEVIFYGHKEEENKIKISKIVKKRVSYVTETINRSQHVSSMPPKEPITLIASWLNKGIAKKDNPFKAYYGDLADFFKSRSVNIHYLGYIWDHENYFDVKRQISKKYDNVIFPEDYLNALDIVKSACLTLLRQVNFEKIVFDGYNLSSLFKHYIAEDQSNTHDSISLSFYYVFKNLKNAGFEIDKFIYPFENQPWEKACIQGIREFYPRCKIIAFKHTTVPQFMLAHFPSQIELEKMPVPDKIVCCGESSYKTLYPYWADKCALENGPALRHSYLFNKRGLPGKSNSVGAALSINVNENIEFLDVILKTAEKLDVSFFIKFHPAAKNDILIKQLNSVNLTNVKIFNGTPDEFLSRIGVMLFTATDLSVQAALGGIPVICYMPMAKLDMNPVNDSFISKKAYDDISLCDALRTILFEKGKFTAPSLDNYYNQTDDNKLSCFIK